LTPEVRTESGLAGAWRLAGQGHRPGICRGAQCLVGRARPIPTLPTHNPL